jgi:hypothetical protein
MALALVCFQSTCGFGYPSFSNSSLDNLAYGAKTALPWTLRSSGTPIYTNQQRSIVKEEVDGEATHTS